MRRMTTLFLLLTIVCFFSFSIAFAEEPNKPTTQQDGVDTVTKIISTEENTGYHAKQILITPPNCASFYIGKGYSFAVADFLNSGFSNIQIIEKKDFKSNLKDNMVLSVSIGEDKNFQAWNRVISDTPVLIEFYHQEMCQLPLESSDLDNIDHSALLESLYEAGFDNIVVDENYDLDTVNENISEITITVDGNSDFSSNTIMPADTLINITYHFPREDGDSWQGAGNVLIPYSFECYMRRNQNDCVQDFIHLGFKNVKACAVTDTLWGFTQAGQTIGISIDGNQSFQQGELYNDDAEVVVYYHVPEFNFIESEFSAIEGEVIAIPYYVGDGDSMDDITIKVGDENALEQISPYLFHTLRTGRFSISAYYQDTLLAKCFVDVKPIPIDSITVLDETASIGVGRVLEIPFTLFPENADRMGLEVISGNTNVAIAELEEGASFVRIRGVKAGNTTVTIRSSNNISTTKQIQIVDVLPEKIVINSKNQTIYVGTTGILSVSVIPSDVTDQKITWKSSAPNVLKVNSDGSYQALAAGETEITATHSKGKFGSMKITVKPVLAKSLNLHSNWDNTKPFYKSDTMTLTAEILPENTTDQTVTWTSNNEAIATVSRQGVVKAISAGEAEITATTSNGIKGTYSIIVPVSPQTFRISASISIKSNDHVGNSWSTGFLFNSNPIQSGNTVSIMPGERFSAGGWAEEGDSRPDYGAYTETIELTNEMCKTGFTIDGNVTVTENGGRYSGHSAIWYIRMHFTPIN